MDVRTHDNGGYRFIAAIAPYSAGVVATPGHEIVWVTLRRPQPLAAGVAAAARLGARDGGSPDSVCAFALRLPAPLTLTGFAEFNERYREALASCGILHADPNPVARTNVVPVSSPPAEPVVHGFAFVRPAPIEEPGGSPFPTTFVVAGAAELRDQALDAAAIVRPGDVSEAGMRAKAEHVLAEMGDRMIGLGVDWADVTTLNVYTRHPVDAWIDELQRPLGSGAVLGHRRFAATPPVEGLDFELDVRGVVTELVLG